jgi:hypothetical protein
MPAVKEREPETRVSIVSNSAECEIGDSAGSQYEIE